MLLFFPFSCLGGGISIAPGDKSQAIDEEKLTEGHLSHTISAEAVKLRLRVTRFSFLFFFLLYLMSVYLD